MDCPPRFPLFLEPIQLAEDANQSSLSLRTFSLSDDEASYLLGAVQSISSLACWVNACSDDPLFWTRDMDAIRALTPPTHRLLSLPRLDVLELSEIGRGKKIVTEMVRLACLALLASVKERFGVGDPEAAPLQARLRAIIHEPIVGLSRSLREWKLWSLMMAAALSKASHAGTIISEAKRTMADLGIVRGEEAIAVVRQMIWISAVCDRDIAALEHELNSPDDILG